MISNEGAAYLEALEALRARGKKVDEPYTTPDGIRHVLVDGFPCTDERVLEEAWGMEAAEQVRKPPEI